MCIIALANDRFLTKEEFKNCWDSNKHGFGMGWFTKDGKQQFLKGIMEYQKAWDTYEEKKEVMGLPHVCHFRIKTAGGIVPELTHPFIVDIDSPTKLEYEGDNSILFHNGSVLGWEKYQQELKDTFFTTIDGAISDTRVVACMVNFRGADILDKIKGGKYIIMKDGGSVEMTGNFTEDKDNKGILFSNSGYTGYRYSSHKNTSYKTDHYKTDAYDEERQDQFEFYEDLFSEDDDGSYKYLVINKFKNMLLDVADADEVQDILPYLDYVDKLDEMDGDDIEIIISENIELSESITKYKEAYDYLSTLMVMIGNNMDRALDRRIKNGKAIGNIKNIMKAKKDGTYVASNILDFKKPLDKDGKEVKDD